MVCCLDAERSDQDLIRGNILALTQWIEETTNTSQGNQFQFQELRYPLKWNIQ